MKEVYRIYEDTATVNYTTKMECPYCHREWLEEDIYNYGKTYVITCGGKHRGGCGEQFELTTIQS